MSGPKCDSYYVEDGSNELLLEAQRAEAARAAQLARERLEAALASGMKAQRKLETATKSGRDLELKHGATIAALREKLPSFPSGAGSVDELERYIARVETAIIQINNEIGRAEGVAQLRSLVAAATTVTQVADWSDQLQARQATVHPQAVEETSAAREKRQEVTQRIIGHLQGGAANEELQSIQTLAREIINATGSGRAEGLETELRLRVQRINERIQKKQQDAAEAHGLLGDLRGLHGAEVDLIRQELLTVSGGRGPSSRDLAARVQAIRESALKRVNDEYAGKVIREELQRLGYDVRQEFSTLFVRGGQAVVNRPEQPEYAVQMDVDAARGILNLAVVRHEGTQQATPAERRLRDKAAEERWCTDHDKLRAAMRARGVNGRILKRSPPGDQPVKTATATKTHDSRRAEKPMRRELR